LKAPKEGKACVGGKGSCFKILEMTMSVIPAPVWDTVVAVLGNGTKRKTKKREFN
jgi:hypothetical protein